jgi:hypothetical protein
VVQYAVLGVSESIFGPDQDDMQLYHRR